MNHQEIFDTAVFGVMNQGRYSKDEHGTCALRGDGGSKCAVGFLVSDEDYRVDLEMWAQITDYEADFRDSIDPEEFLANDLGAAILKTVGNVDEGVMNLLAALQSTHDTCSQGHSMQELANTFRADAATFGLNMKVIDDWQDKQAKVS